MSGYVQVCNLQSLFITNVPIIRPLTGGTGGRMAGGAGEPRTPLHSKGSRQHRPVHPFCERIDIARHRKYGSGGFRPEITSARRWHVPVICRHMRRHVSRVGEVLSWLSIGTACHGQRRTCVPVCPGDMAVTSDVQCWLSPVSCGWGIKGRNPWKGAGGNVLHTVVCTPSGFRQMDTI